MNKNAPGETPRPLLDNGQFSSAVSLDAWDQLQSGLTQLTKATPEKPFFFVQDPLGNKYKVKFDSGYDPGTHVTRRSSQGAIISTNVTATNEPRQVFAEIVRVNDKEMEDWQK